MFDSHGANLTEANYTRKLFLPNFCMLEVLKAIAVISLYYFSDVAVFR